MRKAALGAAFFCASVSAIATTQMPAQSPPSRSATMPATAPAKSTTKASDVRQIVTFQFLPGMTDSATAVYRRELLPAYLADTAMRRFRAFSEAESPEPLDLIVISHFDGMAGMDASNAALRLLSSSGRSVFQWYGVLSAITQRHHDQFAEMLPDLCTLGGQSPGPEHGVRARSQTVPHPTKVRPTASSKKPCIPARIAADTTARLVVMEYVRSASGARTAYETLIASTLLPIERSSAGIRWSETGRLLISDGWDFVRFYGVNSLGAWHDYQSLLRSRGATASADRLVAARKTIIVRDQRALAIR